MTTRSRSAAPAALAALCLAGAGALALAVGGAVSSASATAESLPAVAWLVGWALLVWAAVLGGFIALHLLGGGLPRRRPSSRHPARS